MDRTRLHKRASKLTIGNSAPNITASNEFLAFCYDVGVWQYLNLRNGREFVKHVVPAVLKPARTLWNEVIGFVFICFAVTFGFKAVRLYLDFSHETGEAGANDLVRFSMAGFCTLLMLWFGVSSFLRARKISRS